MLIDFGLTLAEGDEATDDEETWLQFAKEMEQPEFYDLVSKSKPLTPISTFKYPQQIRRHYEKMVRFPVGLLVLGDAVCSFNPVYGQGMSVCALQVGALRDTLAECNGSIDSQTSRSFFRRTARLIDNPWLLATSADFLYDKAEGHRRFGLSILLWYITKVLALSSCNDKVTKSFLEVMHFVKSPAALFHSGGLFPVLGSALGIYGKPSQDRPIIS